MMSNEEEIKPYCPVFDWVNNNSEMVPSLNQCIDFDIDSSNTLTINSNDVGFIKAVSKRLHCYISQKGPLKGTQPTIINVHYIDSASDIVLPKGWQDDHVQTLSSVYMSPHQREKTKLTHLKWGHHECLYRPTDCLISFSQHAKAPVEILLVRLHPEDATKEKRNPTINSDILLDLIQAMYARVNNLYAFHTAYLGFQDKGIIIGGNSGCGKTTTAITLLRSGFSLFSDDMTLLRRHENGGIQGTGWLMPPRFVLKRPSSLDAIEETIIPKKERSQEVRMKILPVPEDPNESTVDFELKKAVTLPESVSRQTKGRWIKPAAIVFLKQHEQEGKGHELFALDSQEGLTTIMSLALDPTHASRREEQIDIVLDLIKQCNVYRLVLGSNICSLPELFQDLLME
jgi:hypothetical protein